MRSDEPAGHAAYAVRPFAAGDAEQIARLFHNTVRIVNRRDYTQQQVEAWASGRAGAEHWRRKLSARSTFVAVAGDLVLGFTDLEDDGHLDHLFVHHDHQRRGVATALHGAAEAEAKRIGVHRLFTEASITARPFFLSQGYRQLRQQTVTIDGVELTNFAMEKRLDPAGSTGRGELP